MLDSHIQRIRRIKKPDVFEAIRTGDKSFEICADTNDLSLQAGDLVVFQEQDTEGKPTGREIVRKVVYKEPLTELRAVLNSASDEDMRRYGIAVLGTATPDYRLLKSIYDYAVTAHLAIDVTKQEEEDWTIIEGPYYSPILAAPDLMETGLLLGLNLSKWPIGRYSITLLARIVDPAIGKTLSVDVIDLLVLTLVADPTEDQRYGGLLFEELDRVAILDGTTLNINGKKVTPLPPSEVQDIILRHESTREEELAKLREIENYPDSGLVGDPRVGVSALTLPDLEK